LHPAGLEPERRRLTPVLNDIPADPARYLEELRVKSPFLFCSHTAKQERQHTETNPFKNEDLNLTQQARLVKTNPTLAKKLAREANYKL
jgi:hypothetical protein